jgi:gluconolactonase
VDRDGNLYFSHGKIISKVTPKGILTQWAETGAPNGHKILPNGHHLICDGQRHAVLELDADGHEVKVAAGSWERQALNMPNDLTLDGKGGFYFTDPGGSSRSHPIGSVYHVAANGSVTRLTTGIAFPNGIVLSKDRKRLYFGESQRNRILFWDLDAKGMPNGDYKVFADLPAPAQPNGAAEPDGMALDAEGRLWIAHFGTGTVRVLSPKGQLLANFPAGNQTVSNLAFGGPKGDQLYITGGDPGCLFRLDVGVKGLPLLPPQRK